MIKCICTVLCAALLFLSSAFSDSEAVTAAVNADLDISCKGAVLIEATTGRVLYENNKDLKLPPASVTKVMTLLLITEAIDSGAISRDDTVIASENAVSMGGTQIYLEVGEEMTVHDLLKSVAVSSANDAAVALAEHIAGSETEFVRRMNEKAAELNCKNTNFTNCTGLFDDGNHYTTAYDLALITAELMKHGIIFEYTSICTDTVRNGTFGLANTNKMMRTYSGMTGMKTGYTSLAGHCLSGTAERDGMKLIAVVLGSETSKLRFSAVGTLLDFGFSAYTVTDGDFEIPESIPVEKGKKESVGIILDGDPEILLEKGKKKELKTETVTEEKLSAPVESGVRVGTVIYTVGGEIIKEIPIITAESVEHTDFFDYMKIIAKKILG